MGMLIFVTNVSVSVGDLFVCEGAANRARAYGLQQVSPGKPFPW